MRIRNSAVASSSSTVSLFQQQNYERFKAWDKNSSVSMRNESSTKSVSALNEKENQQPQKILSEKDVLELSKAAQEGKLEEETETDNKESPSKVNLKPKKNDNYADILKKATQDLTANRTKQQKKNAYIIDNKIAIMQMIIKKFSGKTVKINNPFEEMFATKENLNLYHYSEYSLSAELNQDEQNSDIPDWGMEYEYYESAYSKEGFTYEAKGSVTTEDNRLINFQANLEMVHENMEEKHVHVKKGAALIDPLILNLNGEKEILAEEKFLFDLDNDGVEEEISTLQNGKAFLAIDKNNNGKIDNGSELFGPNTNNGFAELKAYDSDSNGWIDENDEAFSQLLLWQRTSDGSSISSLLDNNVGAIYLGSKDTAYDLLSDPDQETTQSADSEVELQGKLKETSFFLREDGSAAGLIHEVDFAKNTTSDNAPENNDTQADIA